MRHQNSGRKFDRDGSSRDAMFRNLAANLFTHERIETTVQKAKELRRIGADANAATVSDPKIAAERLALKREIGSYLPRWQVRIVEGQAERIDVTEHLFREIAPRFIGRKGGYTRILKTGFRRGDNAEMCLIELVVRDPKVGAKTAVSVSPVTEAVRAEAPKSRSAEEPPAAV
jgi:large subunit ribosomal protein L17